MASSRCEGESLEMELGAGRVIKEEPDIESVALQPTDMYQLIKLEPKLEPDTEDWKCEGGSLEMELDMGRVIKEEPDMESVELQPTDTKPEPKVELDTEDRTCEEDSSEMDPDTGRVLKEELDIGPVVLQQTDTKPEPEVEPDTENGNFNRFTMSNTELLGPVQVESETVEAKRIKKRAARYKKDGATLQREFRERQSAEEKQKRKTAAAAYMRGYRARRKRQSGVSYDEVPKSRKQAGTGDLEQHADATANDEVGATKSTESTEKMQHRRARQAKNSRNYRAQKRASTNKSTTLPVPPN